MNAALRLVVEAALLLSSSGLCQEVQPTSGIRVQVSSAAVTGLDCRRRRFQMEYTKAIGRSYRQMAGMTFPKDPDPRNIAMGLAAMVAMAPLAVLAVPTDLLFAPFRRECDFEFHAEGRLVGWAGTPTGTAELAIDGKSLVTPGVEDAEAPVYAVIRSSATADAQGRFSITVPARVGRGGAFEVRWLVNGLPSGIMSLRKRGGSFVLSEPDPEFGTGLETMEPIVIKPK